MRQYYSTISWVLKANMCRWEVGAYLVLNEHSSEAVEELERRDDMTLYKH